MLPMPPCSLPSRVANAGRLNYQQALKHRLGPSPQATQALPSRPSQRLAPSHWPSATLHVPPALRLEAGAAESNAQQHNSIAAVRQRIVTDRDSFETQPCVNISFRPTLPTALFLNRAPLRQL